MDRKDRFQTMSFLALVTTAILFFNPGSVKAADSELVFYVAPNGSDDNDGTENNPFLTITKARDTARKDTSGRAAKIILSGGSYYDVNVVLGPDDSGLTIEAASGETPVLYGGRPVSDWKPDGDFIAVDLDGVKDREWDFRSFVMNGRMPKRARMPKRGGFEHLTRFNQIWMSSTGGGWKRKPTEKELTTLRYRTDDLGPWIDINNAELVIYHQWDLSMVGVKSIDDESRIVTFSIPTGHPPGAWYYRLDRAITYDVRNTREGMLEPGQWYLDRTRGKLVYWPLLAEDINETSAVVPTTETVIRLEAGADNVTLKGLTISCTLTPLINVGFGAFAFDGAISGEGISNCRFVDLIVENVGGWGIIAYGDNTTIEGCEVRNTGAGGIRAKGANLDVFNNYIHNIGLIYQSAIALQGVGKDCRIRHNEIHGTPYTAITGAGPDLVVENNLIYDIMSVLNDGGAIYCGGEKNITMRGNIVRGSSASRQRSAHAYYLDENSEDSLIENNLAIDTAWPSQHHMNRNCTIRNNVFIDSGRQLLTFPRSIGMTLEKNILVADEIRILAFEAGGIDNIKGWEYDGFAHMPNNVFFSRSGSILYQETTLQGGLKSTRLEPREETIFADPKFTDAKNGDYTFQPDSPALKLGIVPIDVSSAGRIAVKP